MRIVERRFHWDGKEHTLIKSRNVSKCLRGLRHRRSYDGNF